MERSLLSHAHSLEQYESLPDDSDVWLWRSILPYSNMGYVVAHIGAKALQDRYILAFSEG